MKLDQRIENAAIFYITGFLFILIGVVLLNMRYSNWNYEVIVMGVVFLLLGVDASRKPTN